MIRASKNHLGRGLPALWPAVCLVVCLAGVGVGACSSFPALEELRLPRAEYIDPAAYPNLADIPAAPDPLTSEDERREMVESLVTDRARTEQAGDALRRDPVIAPRPLDLSGL